MAPVKLAITFGTHVRGSFPAFQAMVPSTKYSGMVWTIATMARARPLLIENSEASAAHAIRSEAAMTAPNVKNATATVDWGIVRTTTIETVAQIISRRYSTRILPLVRRASLNAGQ